MIRIELTFDEFIDLVSMTNKAVNLQNRLGAMTYPPGYEQYQTFADLDRETAGKYSELRQNILRQFGQQVSI